jgi:hypothetical protein
MRPRAPNTFSGDAMDQLTNQPAFGRFIPLCHAHDIGKTFANELKNAGLLKPFKIGAGTYIEFSEFAELPKRLADPALAARLEKIREENRRSKRKRSRGQERGDKAT